MDDETAYMGRLVTRAGASWRGVADFNDVGIILTGTAQFDGVLGMPEKTLFFPMENIDHFEFYTSPPATEYGPEEDIKLGLSD